MAFYRNPNCPYCGERFTDFDDVVTCPECGTTHHRSCWKEHGACAKAALHGQMPPEEAAPSRPQYEVPQPDASAERTGEACPRCGYHNRPDVHFCSGCGLPFRDNAAPGPTPVVGFDPAQFDPSINFSAGSDFEDVPSIDMTRLVDTNTLYYMPVFARLRAGRSGGLNIAALLFGGSWLLYRKQTRRGIFVLALQVLLKALELFCYYALYWPIYSQVLTAAGIPLNTTMLTPEQNALIMTQLSTLSGGQLLSLLVPTLVSLASFVLALVVAFKANKWYYQDTLQKARRIRSQYGAGSDDTLVAESRQGGVNLALGAATLVGFHAISFIVDFLLMYFSTI
jgi:rubredoxin